MLPSYEQTMTALQFPKEELHQLKRSLKAKQRAALYWWLLSLVLALGVYFSSYFIIESDSIWLWLTFGLSFILFIRYLLARTVNKHKYKMAFKQKVVGPFADTMVKLATLQHENESYEKYCNYYPESHIPIDWINHSELFVTEIDNIKGEDLFTGKYGLTEFQFSELKMTRQETSHDTEGSSTTTVTVFDGVLFVADFKKHFTGLTTISSKLIKSDRGIGKLVSNFLNSTVSTANQRANIKIELENKEFNRHFIVQTTDEIEARYILTPVMIEQILQFVKSHPLPIVISFHDSYMFIAVHSNKNFFDDGVNVKNENINLQGIYNDLAIFLRIIEEFDLNTRIWSKV